jgi:hypothetical protein
MSCIIGIAAQPAEVCAVCPQLCLLMVALLVEAPPGQPQDVEATGGDEIVHLYMDSDDLPEQTQRVPRRVEPESE